MKNIAARRQELLLRANALYEAKEYARAAETAAELLAALPEDVEMRYIRAAALTGAGAIRGGTRGDCSDSCGAPRSCGRGTAGDLHRPCGG